MWDVGQPTTPSMEGVVGGSGYLSGIRHQLFSKANFRVLSHLQVLLVTYYLSGKGTAKA